MTAERDVLISLLRLTQAGPVSRALFAKSSRATVEVVERLLAKLEQLSLFDEYEGIIEVSPRQRVKMTTRALELGADLEHVCRFLSWTEFEIIAAQAFEANGYRVINNFRFKHGEKRREIDVLGLNEPLIICADCKHWRRGMRSAAALRAVEAQVERTRALADALPRYLRKMGLEGWRVAVLLPVVISLLPGQHRLYNKVPIVPVLRLQGFISEVPLELDLLLQIDKKIKPPSGKIDKFL
jgi:Holliday junction resolvase-like predicted endonuclease